MADGWVSMWGEPGGADTAGNAQYEEVAPTEIARAVGITLSPLMLACPPFLGFVRWAFTGFRLAAGVTAAAPNLLTQVVHHRGDFSKYNWWSVGFDYAWGATGYLVSRAIIHKWPAPLLGLRRKPGSWLAVPTVTFSRGAWLNFSKQQVAFLAYSTAVGVVRGLISNNGTVKVAGGTNLQSTLALARSVVTQSILFSDWGKTHAPRGLSDPRVAWLTGAYAFLVDMGIRQAFDIVPHSGQERGSPRR